MKKTWKRFVSFMLVLVMTFCMLPNRAVAAEDSKAKKSVTVYFTLSEDGEIVTGNDANKTKLARVPVTLDYFDLKEYGLEDYYRLESKSFEEGGAYIPGSKVVEQPTMLHLYIKMLEKYYLADGTKVANKTDALSASGPATTMFMTKFWGHGSNLCMFANHTAPLMAKGWGATPDYVLLEDGMEIDVAMFSNSTFFYYGGGAYFTPTNKEIKQGEKVEFTTTKSDMFPGKGGIVHTAPAKGMITKVYDSSWNLVEDITKNVDEVGAFTYEFKNPGKYYVIGSDPKEKEDRDLGTAVAVVDVKPVATVEMTSSPDKTRYVEGEKFDPAGMEIEASYPDGTVKKVTDYTITPNGELTTDVESVDVTGSYEGKKFEFNVPITVTKNVLRTLTVKYNSAKQLTLSPRFNAETYVYEVSVSPYEKELYVYAPAVNSESVVTVNGQPVSERYSAATISIENQDTITVKVSHKDAKDTNYVVLIKREDTTKVNFTVEPKDASIFITDPNGTKIEPQEDGSFSFIEGWKYNYSISKEGYKTVGGTYTVGDEPINVVLEKTQKNENIKEDIPSEWPYFRGNEDNNAVVDVKTPNNTNDAQLYWAKKLGSGWGAWAVGSPIIVNGDIIACSGREVFKVDRFSGEIKQKGAMVGNSNFNIIPPTYANGLIFIGLANGTIQAFNAETLESVWVYKDSLRGQPNSPIIYKNGYVYTGFWNSETRLANFVCVSVTDDDPNSTNESKYATWTHTQKGGFYWSGAYASDNFILVGTDDGESGYLSDTSSIITFDPKTGKVIDTIGNLNGDIRSSVTYDKNTDRYYFTCKGGSFYGVAVNKDGTFKKDAKGVQGYDLKELKLDNFADDSTAPPMSTSTPVIYNGRAYIGVSGTAQFGTFGGHNITVIDLPSWEIAYKAPCKGYPQVSGLLTTAYEKEDGYVYVYFIDNYTPGQVRYIKDKPGVKSVVNPVTETYTDYTGNPVTIKGCAPVLFTPSGDQAQYAICSIICDDDGTMYFKNDSAQMMALGSRIESIEVVEAPNKVTYGVGEKFDTTGMKVVAHQANGIDRDITKYVTIADNAFTVDDTDITISYDKVMYGDKFNAENGNEVNHTYDKLETYVDINVVESVEDLEKIREVEKKIAAIGEVGFESQSKIDAARKAYDLLGEKLQAMVGNYKVLTSAEEAMKSLNDKVKAVEDAISSIGTVTIDSEKKIIDARNAYDALDKTSQAKVTNYDVLTKAEKAIAQIKEAIKSVEDKITSIGTVTIDSEKKIKDARSAYDALDEASQAKVTNYDVLVEAEAKLAEIQKEQENGKPEPPSQNPEEDTKPESPSTGDTHSNVWPTVMAIALAGAIVTFVLRQRRVYQK